jgi:SanA protein
MKIRVYMKLIKKIFLTIVFLVISAVIAIAIADLIIVNQTKSRIFSDVDSVPVNNAGLLLGTSQYLRNGQKNLYFKYRINATVRLFKSGKIKNIVISGDNSQKNYNEPEDMKNELMKQGIPESRIYPDFAGFRTYDSVYRMKEIFGQDSFTIISQEFHNQRAVYIADALKLNATGFNADDVSAYSGFKTRFREKFARVKVFIDLLFDKKPKFLGDKIRINAL